MPETISPSFRDISVRMGERQESFKSEAGQKPPVGLGQGRRKRSFKKRVHLVRNQYICQQCWKIWPEEDVGDQQNKLFYKSKETGDRFLHRRCGGFVCRWYDLSGPPFLEFCRRLFELGDHRDFFPSMSNLVRHDPADTAHHNPICTGTCCHTDRAGSMGPEPSSEASVRTVVSWPTLRGFEEQAAKTCAAAAVAGALNAVFWAAGEGESKKGKEESEMRGRRKKGSFRRVEEQEVLDYYCQWARESGRGSCHAALRGSCGLTPSTRKIGNPRLVRAAHAVGKQLLGAREGREGRAAGALPLCLQPVGEGDGEAGDKEEGSEEEEEEEWEAGDGGSPVEVVRLMGSEACRESIEEGGRCGAEDGAEAEERQWRRLWEEVRGGGGLLLHCRNHYALVFGLREWRCASTGAPRRQLLTASTRQRPHVWFCFRQLRADIVYSKTNQLMLLRRAPRPAPPRIPDPDPGAAATTTGEADAREASPPPLPAIARRGAPSDAPKAPGEREGGGAAS